MDAIRVKLTTAPKAVDRIPKNVDRHKIFAQILPYLKKTYYFCSLINRTKNDYEKNSFIVGLYCCKYFN